MPELIIGCGGWQYFLIPGVDSLEIYSQAFRFVEVNSTFYTLPNHDLVRSWRRRVPESFEFSVKANKMITHIEKLSPSQRALKYLEKCLEVCRILGCRILVLETPRTLPLQLILENLEKLLKLISLGDVRIALEPRCGWSSNPGIVKGFKDLGIIPITDYSREDPPYDDPDISYTRLFGKGEHNIYQFTDEDLIDIRRRAENRRSRKVYLSFHGIAMYLDAARMERFLKTGELPPVTRSYGIDSLAEVLEEARHEFPMSKQALIRKYGWKLIDVDPKTRVPASVILKQLRRKHYQSLEEVISELRARFERTGPKS